MLSEGRVGIDNTFVLCNGLRFIQDLSVFPGLAGLLAFKAT